MRGLAPAFARRWISVCLIATLLLSSITPPRAWAEAQQPSVGEQIATDLIAGGITVGAALSGSLPIAMAAGFLTK